MLTLLDNLGLGLEVALRAPMLAAAILGGTFGLLAAGTPRMAIVALLALLLPVAQQIDAACAMVLLASFVCAAHNGRAPRPARPAVVPAGAGVCGTQAAAPSAAPSALLIAALLGGLAIAVLAPPLTEFAFHFGPAEYVALMLLGLVAAVVLAAGSIIKSLGMLVAGLLLAQIGTTTGDGGGLFGELQGWGLRIDLIPLAIGSATLAGVATMLGSAVLQAPPPAPPSPVAPAAPPGPRPLWRAALRASGIGSLLGVLPGATTALAPLAADVIERQLRPPGQHDDGSTRPFDPDAAHAAAAAAARGGFIPLLALGVPLDASLALLAATLLMHGEPLGPQLMTGAPGLFWGVIMALILVAPPLYLLARPAAAAARRLAAFAEPAHAVLLVGLACIALLAVGTPVDLWMLAGFSLVGLLLVKLGCPIPPLLLGYVLGPPLEANLRHALRLSEGDWSMFLTRPLAAGLLIAAGALIVVLLLPSVRKLRAAAFGDAA